MKPKRPPRDPSIHWHEPDCSLCAIVIAEAGARAFREARREARRRGVGNGQHVPGTHPVADAACAAAERAEAQAPRCWA